MWQWSNSGQYYYYRDNDGRVHYSDGSVSDTNQVWFDNTGKAVYSANSTGLLTRRVSMLFRLKNR